MSDFSLFIIGLMILLVFIKMVDVISKEDIKICCYCKRERICQKQAFLCKCESCKYFEKD